MPSNVRERLRMRWFPKYSWPTHLSSRKDEEVGVKCYLCLLLLHLRHSHLILTLRKNCHSVTFINVFSIQSDFDVKFNKEVLVEAKSLITVMLCSAFFAVLRRVEPILVLEQLGSTFFNIALQIVVRDRSVNATYPDAHLSREDSQQKAITDFHMTNSLILQLVPILPALLLARLGDRGWRRVPIIVPLNGHLLQSIALLLVVVFRLPLEVMFGAAVVYGLSGGFCAYWPGVMTLASLSSTEADRSKVMMRVELLYGIAGVVGSLASGHLFLLYSSGLQHGTILLAVSALLHLLSLIHSIVLLQVKHVSNKEPEDRSHRLPHASSEEAAAGRNWVNIVLLFAAGTLYNTAVGGGIGILDIFVLKEPLSWSATQVGYGNAAGFTIFLTSFLGVMVFRRCVSEVMLIMIGMVSFATGIYFMSFVTATYMFYLARSLTLFALIPLPIIRSLLSQQVPASSCGTILTALQLVLRFVSLAYIPAFAKIYQRTLDWFPGFVFTLSSIITVLGMIPVGIVGCRSLKKRQYERIQED